jgi:hypothetical protein
MSIPLFTNNASTTLALGVGISDTTINLYAGSGALFPSPAGSNYFYISLISSSTNSTEIMKCTNRSGDVLTVVRGQDGTSSQYWNVGDRVELRVTAASLNLFANGAGTNTGTAATQVQEFTATQGQTVFTLSFNYIQNVNNLAVFVNGSKQISSTNYSESTTSSITFSTGLNAGDLVEVIYNLPVAAGQVDASNISYTQGSTGSVTTNVQAKLQQTVSVKDFGAVGDGVTNDTTAIQNAINAAATTSGIVTFPTGTYIVTSPLSLVGKYVSIIGAGMTNTIIKASGTITSIFDIYESSDVINSPFVIQDLQINGNSTTTNGINVRYRHNSVVRNVYIINCTYGMQEKDTWNNFRENVRISNCTIGFYLVGSNHNSHWNCCSANGCTNSGIYVASSGTAADGNYSLLFSSCDVEYGTGAGVVFLGSSAIFQSCYLGENISGAVFTMNGGNVLIQGGLFVYGYTSNTIGFATNAGKIQVQSGIITNQGAATVNSMVRGTGGLIKFFDNSEIQSFGGTPVLYGDFLDYGPAATVFVSRYGKNFTAGSYLSNIPISSSTPSNPIGKTLTVTGSATGSPAIVQLTAPLINTTEWQPNAPVYLVIVYSSNASFSVRLSNGAYGVTPLLSLGSLSSTSGVISTYIKMDQNFDTNAYTTFEIYNSSPVSGNTITLYEVYLADQAMVSSLSASGNNLSNLYKC